MGLAIALPAPFATSPAAVSYMDKSSKGPEPAAVCDVGAPSGDLADCGGGPIVGGGTVPPFNPPPRPFVLQAKVPLYEEGVNQFAWYSCRQVPHVWVGPSNDIAQGTTVYPAGVVVPGTRASFGFYNAAGQLVASHVTRPARANCVIHHEAEAP